MTDSKHALPPVATREAWLAARKQLLAHEKEATRVRDAVNAERRRLPMVRVEKDYVFDGPGGTLRLLDMFEGRAQLYVHHFMWIDAGDTGCPGCTQAAELNFTPKDLAGLHAHDVSFVCISRAPLASITRYKDAHGWTFPWYSSHGNDFNYDFHVTLEASKAPIEYNYLSKSELNARGFEDDALEGDWTGASVFLRDGEDVFHTYSTYARGLDLQAPGYSFLDLTPFGRQEAWEDSPAGWPKKSAPAAQRVQPEVLLQFWREAGPDRWFAKDDDFDAKFRQRFLAAHEQAVAGELANWESSPEGALALILLLDQFPRNCFRGSARMFASDALALAAAERALDAQFDARIDPALRLFFYLPLEHAEDLTLQNRCLDLHERYLPEYADYARVHRDIIGRFGRFPHRNGLLQRSTTPAEQAFLDSGGFHG